jgi:hypothetical protein
MWGFCLKYCDNQNKGCTFVSTNKEKDMKNLITLEVKKATNEKVFKMPLGTYSRLRVNNEVSDIVVNPTSSGVWFHNEPGTIGRDISSKIICFISYSDLKS